MWFKKIHCAIPKNVKVKKKMEKKTAWIQLFLLMDRILHFVKVEKLHKKWNLDIISQTLSDASNNQLLFRSLSYYLPTKIKHIHLLKATPEHCCLSGRWLPRYLTLITWQGYVVDPGYVSLKERWNVTVAKYGTVFFWGWILGPKSARSSWKTPFFEKLEEKWK